MNDPIRQKMLFKTEWHAEGARGPNVHELAGQLNDAFANMASAGFTTNNVMVAGDGVVVLGTKLVSPIADPTPAGVPVPGTNAVQAVEVTYSFIEEGTLKNLRFPTLAEAARAAHADMDAPSRQPMSIHITSMTDYGPGDFSRLAETLGKK